MTKKELETLSKAITKESFRIMHENHQKPISECIDKAFMNILKPKETKK